jgi:hypothetical protein
MATTGTQPQVWYARALVPLCSGPLRAARSGDLEAVPRRPATPTRGRYGPSALRPAQPSPSQIWPGKYETGGGN